MELHDGDIAFRRGSGGASRAVLMANPRGSFSHVGMVVNVDGQWCVIHEVPFEGQSREFDKIYCEPVSDFFNTIKAATGAIYRLSGLDSVQKETICNYARKHLELSTPFDHKYDLTDDSKLYCSELVWRSYLEVGIDLAEERRTKVSVPGFAGIHIMPADIEFCDRLELIYCF